MDLNGTIRAFKSVILKALAARPGSIADGEIWYEGAPTHKAFIQENSQVKMLKPYFSAAYNNVQTSTSGAGYTQLGSMNITGVTGEVWAWFTGNFFLSASGAEMNIAISKNGASLEPPIGRFYIPGAQMVNLVVPITISSYISYDATPYAVQVSWRVVGGTAYCQERQLFIVRGGA